MDKPVCEVPKNSREIYQFRLAEYKGHNFVDMRIFTREDGQDSAPPRKAWPLALSYGRNSGQPWLRWKGP